MPNVPTRNSNIPKQKSLGIIGPTSEKLGGYDTENRYRKLIKGAIDKEIVKYCPTKIVTTSYIGAGEMACEVAILNELPYEVFGNLNVSKTPWPQHVKDKMSRLFRAASKTHTRDYGKAELAIITECDKLLYVGDPTDSNTTSRFQATFHIARNLGIDLIFLDMATPRKTSEEFWEHLSHVNYELSVRRPRNRPTDRSGRFISQEERSERDFVQFLEDYQDILPAETLSDTPSAAPPPPRSDRAERDRLRRIARAEHSRTVTVQPPTGTFLLFTNPTRKDAINARAEAEDREWIASRSSKKSDITKKIADQAKKELETDEGILLSPGRTLDLD